MAGVLRWGWCRWFLAIGLTALAIFLVGSVRLAALPDLIASECYRQDHSQDEQCPGYVIAWIALGTVFDSLYTHRAAVDALATAMIAIFTGTLFWSNIRLWQASNRSADAATAANEIIAYQQRPWVDFDLAAFEQLRFDRKGLSVAIIAARNAGKSPAFNCCVLSEVLWGERVGTQVKIDELKRRLSDWSHQGFSLMPSAESKFREAIMMPQEITGTDGSKMGPISVLLGIRYSQYGRREYLYSVKHYLIMNTGGAMNFPKRGDIYSGEDIILVPDANRTLYT